MAAKVAALQARRPKAQAAAVAHATAAKVANPPLRADDATDGSGGYELEAQVGFRIRRAHQRATEQFNAVMAKFDVTPTQFAALCKLHDLGIVSQNQLGRLTAMDPSTILGVIGRLIRQNLVRGRADPADGRLTLLELTPNGKVQVEAMKAVAAQVSARTLTPLTAKEAKTLLELLERIT